MKKYLIAISMALVGLSGVMAHADTFLIERHSFGQDFSGANFRFDAANGTAWMNIGLSEEIEFGYGVMHFRHSNVKVAVSGLSYDAAAAQIIYTGAHSKFVCATVTERQGRFGTKSMINLTGACRVHTVSENRGVSVYFEAK